MANLPEAGTYDTGIYQLETLDPVEGGAAGKSNAPLINLANRTGWLKAAYDALATFVVSLAPKLSPTFTGTPAAPTPALNDSSTTLATTEFVKGVTGGILSKSVAGSSNVTLTAAEASYGVMLLTGALTGNINVIVPATGKNWIVKNGTSGSFTLTVKTSGGTGIAVTQGRIASLYCDGTNVDRSLTDFASPALTGTPTTPTAAPGTNSTQVASCAFVTAAVAAVGGVTISNTAALDLAAAADGGASTSLAAAIDHVHKRPTAAELSVVPIAGNVDVTGRLGLKTVSLLAVNLGNISGTVHIDLSLGGEFYGTVIGACTFVFDNPPSAGKWGGFDLELTNGASSGAPVFPASVKWPSGIQPALTAAGVDCLSFPTRDGGTTYRAAIWAKDSK